MTNKKIIKKVFDEKLNKEETYQNILSKYNKKEKSNWRYILIPISLIIIVVSLFSVNNINLKNKELKKEGLKEEITTENNSYSDSKKIIKISSYNEDRAFTIKDSKQLEKNVDYIAIIRIDSIDGCSRRNLVTDEPVLHIFTYGKATILNVIKGNLKKEQITYHRSGGTLPYLEWLDADIDKDKLLEQNPNHKIDGVPFEDVVVQEKYPNDIDIEIGKTYLAYITKGTKTDYIIQGYQFGFREIKETNSNNYSNEKSYLKSLKVKNNTTGKWENLSLIVDIK